MCGTIGSITPRLRFRQSQRSEVLMHLDRPCVRALTATDRRPTANANRQPPRKKARTASASANLPFVRRPCQSGDFSKTHPSSQLLLLGRCGILSCQNGFRSSRRTRSPFRPSAFVQIAMRRVLRHRRCVVASAYEAITNTMKWRKPKRLLCAVC